MDQLQKDRLTYVALFVDEHSATSGEDRRSGERRPSSHGGTMTFPSAAVQGIYHNLMNLLVYCLIPHMFIDYMDCNWFAG